MIRIFGGTWVYLAHESEIPNPNDFKTSNLGHRPIIILRDRHHIDEDGVITGTVTDELAIRGDHQDMEAPDES